VIGKEVFQNNIVLKYLLIFIRDKFHNIFNAGKKDTCGCQGRILDYGR
jgi:hypothetical protein